MAGMAPAPTPQDIAKAAGFPAPVTPAAPPMPVAPRPVAPVPAALKGPSAGTTEIIPGQFDWVRQLVLDSFPSPQAQATPIAPEVSAGRGLGAVNGGFAPGMKPISTTPPLIDRVFDIITGGSQPSRQRRSGQGVSG
jgi:hypothetical protein